MGTWLLFDDETVTSISEADIPVYYGESAKGSAYVLYYQAVDIDMAKLGLKKEAEVEPAVIEISQEKKNEGLGFRVGSETFPPPPGLESLDSKPATTNGTNHEATSNLTPVTPRI